MKWTTAELVDRLDQFFEVRNKKILISLPGMNKLIADPRCPNAKESPLIEELLRIKANLEDRQKTRKLNSNQKSKNNEHYRKNFRKSA